MTTEQTKRCPYCAEEILAVAIRCKHCQADLNATVDASSTVARPAHSDTLGTLMLVIPFVSTLFIWFWVGDMNVLSNASSLLSFLGLATVGITAVLGALEAQNVGAGNPNDKDAKGRQRSGPIAWFFAIALLWIVGLPAWLYQRSKYGLKNMIAGGIVIPLVFVGSWGAMNVSIASKLRTVRDAFNTDAISRVLPAAVPEVVPVVTLAKFELLVDGMTYDQAASTIGEPGRLMSSSEIAGYKTVMYAWSNANGSNMNAMFQNGKLTNKAQFGLR